MNFEKFNDMPLVLETPDEKQWAKEIELLEKMIEDK